MSVDNVRPEVNLLTAFTLTIVVTFAAALPMALAIISGFAPDFLALVGSCAPARTLRGLSKMRSS